MKRVAYSSATKAVAFIVCLCMMGAFVYNTIKTVDKYEDINVFNINFEHDIDYSVETKVYQLGDMIGHWNGKNSAVLEKNISDLFENSEAFEYYLELPDQKIKISNQEKLSEYADRKVYYSFEMKEGEITVFDESVNAGEPYFARNTDVSDSEELGSSGSKTEEKSLKIKNAKLYISLTDKYVGERTAMMKTASDDLKNYGKTVTGMVAVGLLALIYLIAVCGRKYGADTVVMTKIDRMFVEFDAALIISAVVSMIGVSAILLENIGVNIIFPVTLFNMSMSAVVITLILSLARNIKNGTFMERSIIKKFCHVVWSFIAKIVRVVWNLIKSLYQKSKELALDITSKTTSLIWLGILAIYTALVLIFAAFAALVSAFGAVMCLICFILGVFFLEKRLKELDKIRDGVKKIKEGKTDFKIDKCKTGDYNELAQNINAIGDGMSEAVEKAVKSERMKTELITNVSHDLKTPLTSIINYSELLKDMDLSPEEAADYVKIISQKADRLKNLTSDLFDVSKVMSGSENVTLERLDICLLIRQSLAELDKEITKVGLDFITKLDSEIFIMADGKKMSRVMSNLIDNITKYALKGTRAYVNVSLIGSEAIIELKNISAYPIEFDADEITERFVRGDESRTAEGNGLGLAIAKSYTELCGGDFKIITDGDLFKVVIKFKIAQ